MDIDSIILKYCKELLSFKKMFKGGFATKEKALAWRNKIKSDYIDAIQQGRSIDEFFGEILKK